MNNEQHSASIWREDESSVWQQSPKTGVHTVHIPIDEITLEGTLRTGAASNALILLPATQGSRRGRYRYLSHILTQAGFSVLQVDLLTEPENGIGHLRFDLNLLFDRFAGVMDWYGLPENNKGLPVGCLATSTVVPTVLTYITRHPETVQTLVSWSGRPDMARQVLPDVKTPFLFLVGSKDDPSLILNEDALSRMSGERQLRVIPEAGHNFEEPGKIDELAHVALDWFFTIYSRKNNRLSLVRLMVVRIRKTRDLGRNLTWNHGCEILPSGGMVANFETRYIKDTRGQPCL